jgi:8-oxo-dGTP pyrophosphatase MutT (NUDIX family)
MEIWDILDERGEKTGRTIMRGEPMGPGEYYLAVHIWIRNPKGEYLIQKRSEEKPLWPGMWAATGGAAVSGETSLEAALREVKEELGFEPDAGRMSFFGRVKRKDWFTDIWLLEQDIDLKDITMQREEVAAVMWAAKVRIIKMVREKEFVEFSYLASFL